MALEEDRANQGHSEFAPWTGSRLAGQFAGLWTSVVS